MRTKPLPVKHSIEIQDGGIENLVYLASRSKTTPALQANGIPAYLRSHTRHYMSRTVHCRLLHLHYICYNDKIISFISYVGEDDEEEDALPSYIEAIVIREELFLDLRKQ